MVQPVVSYPDAAGEEFLGDDLQQGGGGDAGVVEVPPREGALEFGFHGVVHFGAVQRVDALSQTGKRKLGFCRVLSASASFH